MVVRGESLEDFKNNTNILIVRMIPMDTNMPH